MRLEIDLEFQQNEIKKLNTKYNVDMFSTRLRGGKTFAGEQKIRRLKKLLLKSKIIEKRNKNRINPNKLIKKATIKLNNTKSAKYGISPESVEEKSIKNKEFKEVYDFHWLNKLKEDLKRRERSDINSDNRKKNKLRKPLDRAEKVSVLAKRLKNKKMLQVVYIKGQFKLNLTLIKIKYSL